jgi:lysophospholipase L1-like esterase
MNPLGYVPALLFALSVAGASAGDEPDKRMPPMGGNWGMRKPAEPDPALPFILLIGDSIANGYLGSVSKALLGKANVEAWITPTTQADKKLGATIAEICNERKYAVIHFNLGLHGWPAGRIPEGEFEPLTRQLVKNLKRSAPEAVLIWATITPVKARIAPDEASPEIQPILDRHNAMATRVMQSEGLAIDDLDALMRPHLNLMAKDGIHWQPEGREIMARAVADAILKALSNPHTHANNHEHNQ